MDAVELILGVVLCIAAALALFGLESREPLIWLGVSVIAGTVGGLLIASGWHRVNVKQHDKHVAILADLRRQGFDVPYGHVYAEGGNWLDGTEADLVAGACLIPFATTRVDGVWRVTLPASGEGRSAGRVILSPDDVARMAVGCPAS